jgi:AbrB family looped-hinge helix DNA binding protein
MAQATISPKYQLVIPREVRKEVPLAVGQTVTVVAKGGVITLVPQRKIAELRGLAKGAPTTGYRDKADRL